MPGRASSLTVRASVAPRSVIASSDPARGDLLAAADDRLRRQPAEPAARAPGTPPGGPAANARPRSRRPRARRVAPRSTVRPSAVAAAAKPAISPSACDRSAPPTPVASPATNTPATVLAWSSSTVATRLPSASRTCAQPSWSASSGWGVNPYPTATASHSSACSEPGTMRQPASRRATRTPVTASSPRASMTVERVPVRDAVCAQHAQVSGALAQLRRVPQHRQRVTREGGRPPGLEHADDRRARLGQPGRDRQQERPRPRHDDPLPHHDAVSLEQRLRRARGVHAGQRPARERELAVVRRRWRGRPSAPGPRALRPPSSAWTTKPSASRVTCHTWTPARWTSVPAATAVPAASRRPAKACQSWCRAPSSPARCRQYCPPRRGAASSSTTLASPATAATAAARPAGPAPITATSNGAAGAPPVSNQPPSSASATSAGAAAAPVTPVVGPTPDAGISDGPVVMPRPVLGRDDVAGRRLDEARPLVRACR